jgi:hypothetical protein
MSAIEIGELAVANAKASVLGYKNKIRISWSPITQTDITPEYTFHRFASKTSLEADFSNDNQSSFVTASDGSLYYNDLSGSSDTPYYFRVDWTDSTTGSPGEQGKFVFGIRSSDSNDDAYEPNDNWWILPPATTVVPDTMYLKTAGIERKGLTPNSIRHCCATQLLENGADIRFVAELLGYKSLETTSDYTRGVAEGLK